MPSANELRYALDTSNVKREETLTRLKEISQKASKILANIEEEKNKRSTSHR